MERGRMPVYWHARGKTFAYKCATDEYGTGRMSTEDECKKNKKCARAQRGEHHSRGGASHTSDSSAVLCQCHVERFLQPIPWDPIFIIWVSTPPAQANVTRRQVASGQPATKSTRRERLARLKKTVSVPLKLRGCSVADS